MPSDRGAAPLPSQVVSALYGCTPLRSRDMSRASPGLWMMEEGGMMVVAGGVQNLLAVLTFGRSPSGVPL
eukprot:4551636-Prymnesium_polylepis.1